MTLHDAIAAPLAAALARRGYDTLTPVQQAVLDARPAGADALVSAQTGSGKTVAFGLAIAPDLLAGAEALAPAGKPLALIVAPTRELALQVRGELAWLYADTGASIASCVGGMDYRTERRALERGAQIVVGTPGRLRDHLERGALDLSALRAVVLDEADEMLDMGFREDLEALLTAAPEGRRTLMFSATVPAGIARLAKTFQRDALRIETGAGGGQHGDIDYRAFSVAMRDREHAIINTLRLFEARMALVFCKTRAEVNRLLARLSNRGFSAVALSGELSQTERMHALQALRDGRARVCIATDVAARGIDLAGLELVIHADLPSNAESLLHRSGRTGRAGHKGVSVLIVTPADYRKAQRLLREAKLSAEWGGAPSAEEVSARDDARLLESPALSGEVGEDEAAMVAELTARHDAEALAAAFLRIARAGQSAPEEITAPTPPGPAAPRPPREAFGDSVWFSVGAGHEARVEARWLLPKICDAGGITRNEIGAIRVQRACTYVQIAAQAADGFGASADLAPDLVMTRLEGTPVLERPERAPGKPAPRPSAPRPTAPRSSGPRAASRRPDHGEQAAPEKRPAPAKADHREKPAKADRSARAKSPDKAERPAKMERPAKAEAPAMPARAVKAPDAGKAAPAPRAKPAAAAKPVPRAKPAAAAKPAPRAKPASGAEAMPRRALVNAADPSQRLAPRPGKRGADKAGAGAGVGAGGGKPKAGKFAKGAGGAKAGKPRRAPGGAAGGRAAGKAPGGKPRGRG